MITVAIIEGGYSHEKQISLKSSQTVQANLDENKYRTIRVRIDEDGWVAYTNSGKMSPIDKNDFSAILAGEKVTFDYAFIVIHGTPGEDGKLQAYFDMLDIPYNTCSHMLATLTFDKYICNRFLENFNIPVAKAIIIAKNQTYNTEEIISKVGLPCFVKPNDGGSSFGISKVEKIEELKDAIALATKDGNGTQALIESYLEGREVTNGVYLGKKGVHVLPITEIITYNELFDFDAKYKGESDEITPALLSDDMTAKVKKVTKDIFQLLNLTGIARMDYIIVDGVPNLIEINIVPGQTKMSLIPQMAEQDGIPLSQIYDEIIELSL